MRNSGAQVTPALGDTCFTCYICHDVVRRLKIQENQKPLVRGYRSQVRTTASSHRTYSVPVRYWRYGNTVRTRLHRLVLRYLLLQHTQT